MNTRILVLSLFCTTLSYFIPNQVHAQQRNWITYCQDSPAQEDIQKCNRILRALGEVNAAHERAKNNVMCPPDFNPGEYAGEICRLDNEIQYRQDLIKVHEETR